MKQIKRLIAVVSTCRNALAIYLGRLLRREVTTVTLWSGARFFVENTNNNLGTILEVFYEREYADLESVRNIANPIIVDIGANIGTFTVWAGKLLPGATIYAYEPEEKNYSLLTKNIDLNGLSTRATAFQNAVGGEKGTRTLSVAGESSGKNSLSYDVGSGVSAQVSCTTLDDIMSTHGVEQCDCLKIDCEGAEYEILYNTSPENLKRISLIIFEWHGVPGESIEKLTAFLSAHDFAVERSARFYNMATARRTL